MLNAPMLSRHSSIVAVKQTVYSDLGDEVAILNLRSGEYFGLNPVGAFVWVLIQEPKTIGEICDAVVREFDVTAERCQQDIAVLVGELRAQNLVDVTEEA
jgi:hypothetical protein